VHGWVVRSTAAFLLLALSSSVATPQGAGPIRFRFAFGALTGSGQIQKLTRIDQDTELRTGDKIKLMVEMQQPGRVYVIYRGPEDEIELLFPADMKQDLQTARRYFIPDGTDWLEFDEQPGTETFYVLASVRRLTALESLIGRYTGAPAAGKTAIAAEIVAEIRRLRTQSRTAPPAERPVMIGGNVRSLDRTPGRGLPDVSSIAVEITANDFYARTFTIAHR